jgi:hypothetical protein
MKLTGTSLMLGFPPPLWGRDREGGAQRASFPKVTPLPNPPPQGGREQTAAWGGNANIGALNTRPL